MLKKTITYTDYNGTERTEDFYFNLSEAELAEMQLSTEGGMDKKLESIIAAKSKPEIMKMFKEILLKSYGEKSEDGRRFDKSDEISTNFSHTEAYSKIFMELITNDEAASAFINAVIPSHMKDKAPALLSQAQ